MLQHTSSEVTVKTVCNRCLFSFPAEIEMAKEQKYLRVKSIFPPYPPYFYFLVDGVFLLTFAGSTSSIFGYFLDYHADFQ